MKKIITFAAIIGMVIAAHANAVNWTMAGALGFGDFANPNPDGTASFLTVGATSPWVNAASGARAYLFLDNGTTITLSTIETAILSDNFSSFESSALAARTIMPNGALGSGEVKDGATDIVSAGATVTFYMVVFNTGNYTTANWYTIGALTATVSPDPNTTFVTGIPAATAFEGVWKPIPEPASMVLVGIGIVALGLRRRRK